MSKNLTCLLLICLLLLFWCLNISEIAFRDDVLLWDWGLTHLPNSLLDFFNPASGFFKAWPLSASMIWLVWKSGLATLTFYKIAVMILHIANFFCLRKLLQNSTWRYEYIALVHPIFYLSLSWAYQFITLISVLFALLAWIFLERAFQSKPFRSLLASAIWFGVSILTKPWAVLLAPVGAFLFVLRSKSFAIRKAPSIGKLIAIAVFSIIVVWLGYRAYSYSGRGLTVFLYEDKAMKEFDTGSKEQLKPLMFPHIAHEPIELTPFEKFLRKSLYMTANAERYSLMMIGAGSLSPCQPRPESATSEFIVGGTIIFAFGILIIFLIIEYFLTAKRKRLSEHEWWLWTRGVIWIVAAWLPVSGFVYVPSMKYSLTSPHYAVALIPGFLFLIQALVETLLARKVFNPTMIKYGLTAICAVFLARQSYMYWNLNHLSSPDESHECVIFQIHFEKRI